MLYEVITCIRNPDHGLFGIHDTKINDRIHLDGNIVPGNGLDQGVPLNGFVDVHGIQEGHVKARQPHIDHDGDLEIGFGVFELRNNFV